MADGEINRNGATIRIDDDGGVQVEPAAGEEVEFTGPDSGTDADRESVKTDDIRTKGVLKESMEISIADDSVWSTNDTSIVAVELIGDNEDEYAFFGTDYTDINGGIFNQDVVNEGGSTVLDGTTGPDQKISISRNQPTLYIENRRGEEKTFTVIFTNVRTS